MLGALLVDSSYCSDSAPLLGGLVLGLLMRFSRTGLLMVQMAPKSRHEIAFQRH